MFAATCIGVGLMVVMVEFLRRLGKEYDCLIYRRFRQHVEAQSAARPKTDSGSLRRPQSVVFRPSPLQQLIRAVIHAATFGLAYIVMLLAMYYNGYVIISIFIGAAIGKFACDWTAQVVHSADQQESTESGIEETTVCCG